MANSRIEFLEKKYYNIYNCWFNKKEIFLDDFDYIRFYDTIIKYLRIEKDVNMISYCFLGNHFHLILHSLKTGYWISDFMRKVQLSYSIYFKNKYPDLYWKSLFEWRFKSKLIDSIDYLHKSLAYVNYNSIHHNYTDNILNHKHTSYHRLVKVWTINFEKYKWIQLEELEF